MKLYEAERGQIKKPTCVGFFIGLNQFISLLVQRQEPWQQQRPEQKQPEQKRHQQPMQELEQVPEQPLEQELELQRAFGRKR